MKVKIKTWEKMEKEFGLSSGIIDCNASFTPMMEAGMPEGRIIDVNKKNGYYIWNCWTISDDMIEK